MPSNPCGRGGQGRPIDLASPYPHIIQILREAESGGGGGGYNNGGLTSTNSTEGCWIATLWPIPWIWAVYYNTPISPDRVHGDGVAFLCGVIPCPFSENRTRDPGTNRFIHEQDGNNVLTYVWAYANLISPIHTLNSPPRSTLSTLSNPPPLHAHFTCNQLALLFPSPMP